jgi:hypothetical protein
MTVIHNAREDRRHKRLNVDIPGTDPQSLRKLADLIGYVERRAAHHL